MLIDLGGIASSLSVAIYDLSSLSGHDDKDNADDTYEVTYVFRVTSDGTVDITRDRAADIANDEVYIAPAAGQSLWVRATKISGDTLNVGNTLGVWHSLLTQRSWGLTYTVSGGGPDLKVYTIKFELSTDSGGSDIVATSSNLNCNIGHTGP